MGARIWIGIDPGRKTGVAVFDARERRFLSLETMQVDEALEVVSAFHRGSPGDVAVALEDAHLFGLAALQSPGKRQGAGAIKRESTIWKEFLKRKKIPHEIVAPREHETKVTEDYFKQTTGWRGRSSEHSRDAATLVWNKKA